MPVGRDDEIGRLADAFNAMADRVETAHGALHESHEQTHFALAAARIGVWEAQLATGEMVCSDSVAETRGLPLSAGPRSVDEFLGPVHADDRDALRSVLEGNVRTTDMFDVSYRLIQPGGSMLWAVAKGRLKRDGDGHPTSILGVSVDVTEQRQLDEAGNQQT